MPRQIDDGLGGGSAAADAALSVKVFRDRLFAPESVCLKATLVV